MDDTALRTVLVSGISRKMPTNVLEMCLKSKQDNGGDLEKIVHEDGQETAVVIFKDTEGVRIYC